MKPNGPVVWLVAFCVAVPRFLPVLVNSWVVSCHGEALRQYQVQIDGGEVSCHDETV